jgi:DNA-binding transcriptional ArsR family regulator
VVSTFQLCLKHEKSHLLATIEVLDEDLAVTSLAALAQAQRLRALRALVVAEQEGLTLGVIAKLLGMTPSAFSFHLKELSHAGLVSSEARGRNLTYRAEFARMNALHDYLTEQCC